MGFQRLDTVRLSDLWSFVRNRGGRWQPIRDVCQRWVAGQGKTIEQLANGEREKPEPDRPGNQTLEGTSKQQGRKKKTITENSNIIDLFEKLCSDGKVSFKHGGQKAAVDSLFIKFPDYQWDTIRKLIQPLYNEKKKANRTK